MIYALHRSRRALLIVFVACVPALHAPEAFADDPVIETPVLREATGSMQATALPDLTKYQLTATCALPDAGATPSQPNCAGTIAFYATDLHGTTTQKLVVLPVDVPIGTATIPVTLEQVAAIVAKSDTAYVKAIYSAAAQGDQDLFGPGRTFWVDSEAVSRLSCNIPATIPYKAAKPIARLVEVRTNVSNPTGDETAPQTTSFTSTSIDKTRRFDKRYWSVARAATTIKLNGLTYTFAKGTTFGFQCVKVEKFRLFAVPYVRHGSVHVTGKPNAKQQRAGVLTYAGAFSTDVARMNVDFTVQGNGFEDVKPHQNPYKVIKATLRTKRGLLVARQRNKRAPSAHCTPGASIVMRFDGTTTVIKSHGHR